LIVSDMLYSLICRSPQIPGFSSPYPVQFIVIIT